VLLALGVPIGALAERTIDGRQLTTAPPLSEAAAHWIFATRVYTQQYCTDSFAGLDQYVCMTWRRRC
jgi:hypothetical protein